MSDKKLFVYSTLTGDQEYKINDGAEVVHINGGAHLTNRNLITSKGAVTSITPEQYVALQANHVFSLHVSNGFITVEETEHRIEDVAGALNPNDPSKPDTVETLKEAGADVPTAAKPATKKK